MTLNMLRTSRSDPSKSAYEVLEGKFDYNKTPLAPPGTKALIYKGKSRSIKLNSLTPLVNEIKTFFNSKKNMTDINMAKEILTFLEISIFSVQNPSTNIETG